MFMCDFFLTNLKLLEETFMIPYLIFSSVFNFLRGGGHIKEKEGMKCLSQLMNLKLLT